MDIHSVILFITTPPLVVVFQVAAASTLQYDWLIHALQESGVISLLSYWLWLKTLDPVPSSKLAEAVSYAQNQKPYLSAFLDHGEAE